MSALEFYFVNRSRSKFKFEFESKEFKFLKGLNNGRSYFLFPFDHGTKSWPRSAKLAPRPSQPTRHAPPLNTHLT
jgi:hypothetical protein